MGGWLGRGDYKRHKGMGVKFRGIRRERGWSVSSRIRRKRGR